MHSRIENFVFLELCMRRLGGEEDKRTRKAKQGKGNRKRDEEGKERETQHYARRKRWRPKEKGSENRKTRKGEGAQEEKKQRRFSFGLMRPFPLCLGAAFANVFFHFGE